MALIKKQFWELLKNIFFKITLYQEKSNLALVVHNLHNRKNLQKQISFTCAKVPRNEPVTQNSKKKPLSPYPIYRNFNHKHLFRIMFLYAQLQKWLEQLGMS